MNEEKDMKRMVMSRTLSIMWLERLDGKLVVYIGNNPVNRIQVIGHSILHVIINMRIIEFVSLSSSIT